jgi:hypothetical protein
VGVPTTRRLYFERLEGACELAVVISTLHPLSANPFANAYDISFGKAVNSSWYTTSAVCFR